MGMPLITKGIPERRARFGGKLKSVGPPTNGRGRGLQSRSGPAVATLSDARNKENALRRIKRLGSAGLPLEPFAKTLFEVLEEAIPHNPNDVLFSFNKHEVAYIP